MGIKSFLKSVANKPTSHLGICPGCDVVFDAAGIYQKAAVSTQDVHCVFCGEIIMKYTDDLKQDAITDFHINPEVKQ